MVNLRDKLRNYKYVHLVRGFAFTLVALMNLKIWILEKNKLYLVFAVTILVIALMCFLEKIIKRKK